MLKFFLSLRYIIVLAVASVPAHQKATRNDQWEADDPRWDTKIPNWWEDSFVSPMGPVEERSRLFWVNHGQNLLKDKINKKLNLNKAKNLVIMIGDGMGISTQMAARSYAADVKSELSFEKFPYSGLSKTYCINYQVPDSACTATAIIAGVKTNFNVLSLTGDVGLRNCSSQQDVSNHVENIFKFAQDAGKSTGFVTTTRITHATPAAIYAKSSTRYWETNEGVPEGCDDIALQLINGDIGSKLDVIMGGGRRSFLPNFHVNEIGERGFRTDSRNLISEYREMYRRQGTRASYVKNRDELMNLRTDNTDKILGIFAHNHIQYKLLSDGLNQPSLKEMTAKALEMMTKNKNGFVLMVEGGRIDQGHHETRARLALHETLEFDETVEFVKQNTNEDDTLLVVTADHGHVFTVGGYTPRGRNILGVGDFSRSDWMWFFTLGYANGPGYVDHTNPSGGRRNPRGQQYIDPLFRQPTTVNKEEETHSGEDVGVYASGPFSHIFSGVYEQSYIGHAMTYATCLGPPDFLKNPNCNGGASFKVISLGIIIVSLIVNLFVYNFYSPCR